MGYNMKRGNSPIPFKELGSSPAKVDLTKKPVGPVNPDLEKIEKIGTWDVEKQMIEGTKEGEGFEADNPKVQFARRYKRTGNISQ